MRSIKNFNFFHPFHIAMKDKIGRKFKGEEKMKNISLCIVSKTHEIERLLGGCILNSSCFEISTQKI